MPQALTKGRAMFIVAAWGTLPISRVISSVTMTPFSPPRWGPSHVAILLRATPTVAERTGHKDLWVESSTLLPRKCIWAKKKVVGLQCHDILDRYSDYPQGSVKLYSLRVPLEQEIEAALCDVIFHDWIENKVVSKHPVLSRLLFGRQEAHLCSEFVQRVMVATGRSRIRDRRPYRSPAAFLRYHLKHGNIIQESR